jgi:hypothetical protein
MANLSIVMETDAENPIVGDLRLTNNQFTIVEGSESLGDPNDPDRGVEGVRQHLRQRHLFFRGEWFLDRRQGFPYFERVLIKNADLPGIRTLERRLIVDTPGIASVSELDLGLSASRQLSIDYKAHTTNGQDIDFGPLILLGPEEA